MEESQFKHKQKKLHLLMVEDMISANDIRKHYLLHKFESLLRDLTKIATADYISSHPGGVLG